MDKKWIKLVNELVLYYWIGLQPKHTVDEIISEYLFETKQTYKDLLRTHDAK